MFSKRNLETALDYTRNSTGGSRKRKGMGLMALLVLAAIIPGLVAATVFLNGTATSTTSGTATTISTATCGWEIAKTNGATDANYVQIVTGSSTSIGTDSNTGHAVYSTLAFNLQGLELGNSASTAYEYLDGEFAYVCLTQSQNGAGGGGLATLTASVSQGTTGATWATMDMEWITGVTALPTPVYCAPGGDTGASCTGTAQTSCAGTSPAPQLYEPNDGGSHYYDWDTVSEAPVSGCGAVNTWTLGYEPGTIYYYGYESFAFVGTSGGGLSSLVLGNTWTLTSTVSPNP